jgi:predicted esterase
MLTYSMIRRWGSLRSGVAATTVFVMLAACRAATPARLDASWDAEAEADASPDAGAFTAPRDGAPHGVTAEAAPTVTTDWCIEGMLRALDEETCFILPELAAGKPRRLLVYLHGIVPPQAVSPQKTRVEEAVLHASVRAGAAALVPRGRRGIGPEGARDWWAWPTAPSSHAALAKSIVAQWAVAKAHLERIAGAPFERTYLAGSSNGAYFLSALALRGDPEAFGFPVDGYGAMSGGAAGGLRASQAAHAFYIGFGTYDEETKKNANALRAVLEAAHWPVRAAEHPLGHGANEIYIDEAFVFWDAPR